MIVAWNIFNIAYNDQGHTLLSEFKRFILTPEHSNDPVQLNGLTYVIKVGFFLKKKRVLRFRCIVVISLLLICWNSTQIRLRKCSFRFRLWYWLHILTDQLRSNFFSTGGIIQSFILKQWSLMDRCAWVANHCFFIFIFHLPIFVTVDARFNAWPIRQFMCAKRIQRHSLYQINFKPVIIWSINCELNFFFVSIEHNLSSFFIRMNALR